MQLLRKYLEQALQFERLAASEHDPKRKAELDSQAQAYRNLAAERARKLGLPPPSPPEKVS